MGTFGLHTLKFLLLSVGVTCIGCNQRLCYREMMHKQRFKCVDHYITFDVTFEIGDTMVIEKIGDRKAGESRIFWLSCSQYKLEVVEIFDGAELRAGDSLLVNIDSFQDDTLNYTVQAKYGIFSMKAVRIKNAK